MSLQIRRGTAAQLANIVPASGELIFTTDTQQLYVGNGVQVGGLPVAYTGNGVITASGFYTTGVVSAAGNIITSSNIVTTGTTISSNIATTGIISATGNITTAGNIVTTGTTISSNIATTGIISATGNITTAGTSSRYMDVDIPVVANITATGTYSLSTTNSINLLIANNTGYTATLNMPATPVNGQICNFAVHGNAVTLAVGTGTVLPTFAGSSAVGTGYRYVYQTSTSSWYKIG
jgi:Major tropism determinant N-terminal domain